MRQSQIQIKYCMEIQKPEKGAATKDGLKIQGVAMPLGEVSGNQVFYRTEAINKNFKSMENKPVLFNHDEMFVVGRVDKVEIANGKLMYEANINPDAQVNGNNVVRMVQRGDIQSMSIHAIVENVEFVDDTDNGGERMEVDVQRFVELSLAPIPGFDNSTIQSESVFQQLTEALKMTEDDKEQPEEEKKEEERPEEVEPAPGGGNEGEPEKAAPGEPENIADAPVEDLTGEKLLALELRVKALESVISNALKKDDDEDDDEEEEQDDDDKDDKDNPKDKDKKKDESFDFPTDAEAPRESIVASATGPSETMTPEERMQKARDYNRPEWIRGE